MLRVERWEYQKVHDVSGILSCLPGRGPQAASNDRNCGSHGAFVHNCHDSPYARRVLIRELGWDDLFISLAQVMPLSQLL